MMSDKMRRYNYVPMGFELTAFDDLLGLEDSPPNTGRKVQNSLTEGYTAVVFRLQHETFCDYFFNTGELKSMTDHR